MEATEEDASPSPDLDEGPNEHNGILTSDLARLVSAYLRSVGCLKTRDLFLRENRDMAPFVELQARGLIRHVDSTLLDFGGLGLHDMLNEYFQIKGLLDELLAKVLPEQNQENLFKSDGSIRKLKVLSEHFLELKWNSRGSSPVCARTPVRTPPSGSSSSNVSVNSNNQDVNRAAADCSSTIKSAEKAIAKLQTSSVPPKLSKFIYWPGNNSPNSTNKVLMKSRRPIKRKHNPAFPSRQPPIKFTVTPLSEGNDQAACLGMASDNDQQDVGDPGPAPTEPNDGTDAEPKSPSAEANKGAAPVSWSGVRSRRSCLKSKAPNRKSLAPETGEDHGGELDVRKRLGVFTQQSDEDLINRILGEPLANILASHTADDTVADSTSAGGTATAPMNQDVEAAERFLADEALIHNLMKVLDDLEVPNSSLAAAAAAAAAAERPKLTDDVVDDELAAVNSVSPRLSINTEDEEGANNDYSDGRHHNHVQDVVTTGSANLPEVMERELPEQLQGDQQSQHLQRLCEEPQEAPDLSAMGRAQEEFLGQATSRSGPAGPDLQETTKSDIGDDLNKLPKISQGGNSPRKRADPLPSVQSSPSAGNNLPSQKADKFAAEQQETEPCLEQELLRPHLSVTGQGTMVPEESVVVVRMDEQLPVVATKEKASSSGGTGNTSEFRKESGESATDGKLPETPADDLAGGVPSSFSAAKASSPSSTLKDHQSPRSETIAEEGPNDKEHGQLQQLHPSPTPAIEPKGEPLPMEMLELSAMAKEQGLELAQISASIGVRLDSSDLQKEIESIRADHNPLKRLGPQTHCKRVVTVDPPLPLIPLLPGPSAPFNTLRVGQLAVGTSTPLDATVKGPPAIILQKLDAALTAKMTAQSPAGVPIIDLTNDDAEADYVVEQEDMEPRRNAKRLMMDSDPKPGIQQIVKNSGKQSKANHRGLAPTLTTTVTCHETAEEVCYVVGGDSFVQEAPVPIEVCQAPGSCAAALSASPKVRLSEGKGLEVHEVLSRSRQGQSGNAVGQGTNSAQVTVMVPADENAFSASNVKSTSRFIPMLQVPVDQLSKTGDLVPEKTRRTTKSDNTTVQPPVLLKQLKKRQRSHQHLHQKCVDGPQPPQVVAVPSQVQPEQGHHQPQQSFIHLQGQPRQEHQKVVGVILTINLGSSSVNVEGAAVPACKEGCSSGVILATKDSSKLTSRSLLASLYTTKRGGGSRLDHVSRRDINDQQSVHEKGMAELIWKMLPTELQKAVTTASTNAVLIAGQDGNPNIKGPVRECSLIKVSSMTPSEEDRLKDQLLHNLLRVPSSPRSNPSTSSQGPGPGPSPCSSWMAPLAAGQSLPPAFLVGKDYASPSKGVTTNIGPSSNGAIPDTPPGPSRGAPSTVSTGPSPSTRSCPLSLAGEGPLQSVPSASSAPGPSPGSHPGPGTPSKTTNYLSVYQMNRMTSPKKTPLKTPSKHVLTVPVPRLCDMVKSPVAKKRLSGALKVPDEQQDLHFLRPDPEPALTPCKTGQEDASPHLPLDTPIKDGALYFSSPGGSWASTPSKSAALDRGFRLSQRSTPKLHNTPNSDFQDDGSPKDRLCSTPLRLLREASLSLADTLPIFSTPSTTKSTPTSGGRHASGGKWGKALDFASPTAGGALEPLGGVADLGDASFKAGVRPLSTSTPEGTRTPNSSRGAASRRALTSKANLSQLFNELAPTGRAESSSSEVEQDTAIEFTLLPPADSTPNPVVVSNHGRESEGGPSNGNPSSIEVDSNHPQSSKGNAALLKSKMGLKSTADDRQQEALPGEAQIEAANRNGRSNSREKSCLKDVASSGDLKGAVDVLAGMEPKLGARNKKNSSRASKGELPGKQSGQENSSCVDGADKGPVQETRESVGPSNRIQEKNIKGAGKGASSTESQSFALDLRQIGSPHIQPKGSKSSLDDKVSSAVKVSESSSNGEVVKDSVRKIQPASGTTKKVNPRGKKSMRKSPLVPREDFLYRSQEKVSHETNDSVAITTESVVHGPVTNNEPTISRVRQKASVHSQARSTSSKAASNPKVDGSLANSSEMEPSFKSDDACRYSDKPDAAADDDRGANAEVLDDIVREKRRIYMEVRNRRRSGKGKAATNSPDDSSPTMLPGWKFPDILSLDDYEFLSPWKSPHAGPSDRFRSPFKGGEEPAKEKPLQGQGQGPVSCAALKTEDAKFLSPSKRIPKRALITTLSGRSPMKTRYLSTWEHSNDVNNLDNYTERKRAVKALSKAKVNQSTDSSCNPLDVDSPDDYDSQATSSPGPKTPSKRPSLVFNVRQSPRLKSKVAQRNSSSIKSEAVLRQSPVGKGRPKVKVDDPTTVPLDPSRELVPQLTSKGSSAEAASPPMPSTGVSLHSALGLIPKNSGNPGAGGSHQQQQQSVFNSPSSDRGTFSAREASENLAILFRAARASERKEPSLEDKSSPSQPADVKKVKGEGKDSKCPLKVSKTSRKRRRRRKGATAKALVWLSISGSVSTFFDSVRDTNVKKLDKEPNSPQVTIHTTDA